MFTQVGDINTRFHSVKLRVCADCKSYCSDEHSDNNMQVGVWVCGSPISVCVYSFILSHGFGDSTNFSFLVSFSFSLAPHPFSVHDQTNTLLFLRVTIILEKQHNLTP